MSALLVEADVAYRECGKTYLTSHALADFRRCPLLHHQKSEGIIRDEDSPAYAWGRATHCLILEGAEEFERRYTVSDGPTNPKTGAPYGRQTKAYGDWLAEQRREIVSAADAAVMRDMAAAVRSHPIAARLLAEGQAEGVARVEEGYAKLPCQSRLDWYGPAGIVDLKTCSDIDRFTWQARDYGYGYQLAYYRDMACYYTGALEPVHLVAVEKQAPYRVGVFNYPAALLAKASKANAEAAEALAECRKTGNWPTGYEELRELEAL